MEQEQIIETITHLFEGADEHDWGKIQGTMADSVLLDYTSMAGGTPATLTPRQITDAWSAFLPGFDKTHHQLSDFEVSQKSASATVRYYGKADHVIGQEIWTVAGSYETELKRDNEQWCIISQKFTLKTQSGNLELPSLATKKMSATNSAG